MAFFCPNGRESTQFISLTLTFAAAKHPEYEVVDQ